MKIKLLSFILALFCLFSIIFAGCSEDIPEETSSAVTDETSEVAVETEPEAPSEYTLISGGEGIFSIVRPEELDSSDPAVQAAIEIRKYINSQTGVSLKLGDDWIQTGAEHDSESFEILIGATSYPESVEVKSTLGYGEYAIRAVGNKIVILSYTDTGYAKAINRFNSIIRRGMTEGDDGNITVTINADDLNILETVNEMTSNLPLFEGGSSSAVANAGEGCYDVVIKDATAEEYKSYVSKLTEKGYTTYSENEIAGSLFTILYTDDYTVNAGYYNNIDEVRIIIEPYADDTLPTLKSDAAPITTTQLTMLGLDNIIGGEYQNNGLSLIYRLSDGSFVIVDGGHSEDASVSANDIINALREQSKDYAASDKDIRIAAWIITHPHSDHFGTFVKAYSQFSSMKIERIFGNFWPEETFEALKAAKESFAAGKYTTYTQTYGIAEKIGADYVVPHVGQVWYFGDTAFEFLYTVESFLPRTTPTFNTSSLIFRTVTTDPSGKEYTVMVTGDATGYTMQIIADTFGSELKCDVVQLAHHGSITSGNSGGTQKAYELMSPSVLLWPVGRNHYSTVATYTYNHVLLEGKNPNFAELYIAGWQGNAVTLPLPYTVGNAIVNEVFEPKN